MQWAGELHVHFGQWTEGVINHGGPFPREAGHRASKTANIITVILVVQHVDLVATCSTTDITFLIFAVLDLQCRLWHFCCRPINGFYIIRYCTHQRSLSTSSRVSTEMGNPCVLVCKSSQPTVRTDNLHISLLIQNVKELTAKARIHPENLNVSSPQYTMLKWSSSLSAVLTRSEFYAQIKNKLGSVSR